MKKIFLTSFFLIAASLQAADWKSQGFDLISSEKDPSNTITDILKDGSGNEISVNHTEEVPDNIAGIIRKLNSDFRSWTSMKVNSIKFSIIDDEIQIFVSPVEYRTQDIDITEHLSGGILFNYHGNLMYNFRIMVDKLFVPIKGIFTDEKSFTAKILSAIKDPKAYINARDPEYLLEKMDKLTVEFEKLRASLLAAQNFNKEVEKEVIDEVIRIKSEYPDYNWQKINDVIQKDKKVKASAGVVRAILSIYYNEY